MKEFEIIVVDKWQDLEKQIKKGHELGYEVKFTNLAIDKQNRHIFYAYMEKES